MHTGIALPSIVLAALLAAPPFASAAAKPSAKSAGSAIKSAVAPVAGLQAPTSVAVNQGAGTATVTWSATGSPSTFTVQVISFASGLTTSTVPGSARAFTHKVTPGSVYHYRIRANTATASSGFTDVVDLDLR